MRKPISFLIAFILVLVMVACSAGLPTTTAASVGQNTTTSVSPTVVENLSPSTAAVATTSVANALAENSQTHESAADYEVDADAAIVIALNGESISASGAGVKLDGSLATITTPGTYRISGSLTDGQIVVNTSAKGTVTLIFDGADLHSSTSAPIYVMDAGKVVIMLAVGTQNTVTDADTYVFASEGVDEPNAAIFSKADLTIFGDGSLTVNGNYQDGITSKDGLIIASGTLNVTAVDDGIRGKDYLIVKDGTLTVSVQGDGMKSDNDVDAALGYISVAAGKLTVTASGDAINAQTDVIITGGNFALTSGEGANGHLVDTISTKGIKGAARVVIDGGVFEIDLSDDSIHSNGSITINNGNFNLATGDDGIHADESLTINNGDIQITQSYEGLESTVITLNGGTIHITASDDGVNVAGGIDGSGFRPGAGGAPGTGAGTDASAYTGAYHLYIHGGYLFVDARGDGIDVNGAFEMTDGVVLVIGPTEQMNGAIDYDAGFNMTGGFLAATGSSGMAMTAGVYSSQNAVLVYLTATQPAGTLVHIQDSSGKDLLTFAPTREYQSIAFSSPDMLSGQTYTIYTGGSVSGDVTDGLSQGGVYTPGSQAASFTVASTVTTVGTGGRMGPGRGASP